MKRYAEFKVPKYTREQLPEINADERVTKFLAHPSMKRPFLIISWLLVWPISVCLFPNMTSSSPCTLFFQKEIERKELIHHRVHKGEHLFSILRSLYGTLPPEETLSSMIEQIRRLNPGMRDLNRIYPGQTLHLPQLPLDTESKTRHFSGLKPDLTSNQTQTTTRTRYTVRPGDHLYKILRKQGQFSNEEIHSRYLDLCKRLNPGIDNFNSLEVGQTLVLPLPNEQGVAHSDQEPMTSVPQTDSKAPQDPSPQIEHHSPFEHDQSKDLAMAVLRIIGFAFASGKEIIYPYGQRGWCHLNLQKTPLASSPWGHPITFFPMEQTAETLTTALQKSGLYICHIHNSWDLDSLLRRLEDLFDNKFIYWEGKNRLIVNHTNQLLELQADYQVVVKHTLDKSYYLFNLCPCTQSCPSPLIYGYLTDQNIYLFHRDKTSNKPRFAIPDFPPSDSLYVPQISPHELRNVIKKKRHDSTLNLPFEAFHNTSSAFLANLQEKGIASQKILRFSWGGSQSITLDLTLFQITRGREDIFLLPKTQANPYLVAFLRMNGYSCYVVSE
jgi:LysM repeat protein